MPTDTSENGLESLIVAFLVKEAGVEHGRSQLSRMWDKRLRGYQAMGYVVHMQG